MSDDQEHKRDRLSRRGFLVAVFGSLAGVVAFWSGQSFSPLDPINLIAPRKQGDGPNHLPINRTAEQARITADLVDENWRLIVKRGSRMRTFSYAELLAMPQHTVELPIACVNGWSQTATWRGVRLNTLMDAVGRERGEAIMLTSLEKKGNYRVTTMGAEFVVLLQSGYKGQSLWWHIGISLFRTLVGFADVL